MKKNKKNEMAALLATMVKDQTITPEIYFKGIRKMAEMERRIRVNPMYSRVLDEYALNLAHSSYMTTIYNRQIVKGEYYNPDCNGLYQHTKSHIYRMISKAICSSIII